MYALVHRKAILDKGKYLLTYLKKCIRKYLVPRYFIKAMQVCIYTDKPADSFLQVRVFTRDTTGQHATHGMANRYLLAYMKNISLYQ